MAAAKSFSTNVLFNVGVYAVALNTFWIAVIVVFKALKMSAASLASFAYCVVLDTVAITC